MKVFISQAMKGLTDDEIRDKKNYMKQRVRYLFGKDVEIIDTYIHDDPPRDVNIPVYYLGRSLELLAQADLAYFEHTYANHHGCNLEFEACKAYGIPRFVDGIIYD